MATLDLAPAEVFARIAYDLRFKAAPERVAILAAAICKCHPVELVGTIGIADMYKLADGSHPYFQLAAKKWPGTYRRIKPPEPPPTEQKE